MKTVLTAALCFFPFLSSQVKAAPDHEFRGIQKLDLNIASGQVTVTGVEGVLATVGVVKKRYDERCRLIVEQRNETLFVELAPKGLFEARCEADFEFRLPKSVGLKFKNGSGNLSVTGVNGKLHAESGSGEIRAQGLQAPALVRTGSGSVHLVFEKVPAEGAVDIHSGSGDAEILFPKRSKIRTNFVAGSGTLKNSLGDSRDAHFTVSMKSGSGNLTVGRF